MVAFQDQRVKFQCTIKTDDIIDTNWDINGAIHYFLTNEAYRQQNTRSTNGSIVGQYSFFLLARANLNNSIIRAKYRSIDLHDWNYTCSHNVTLRIQGNNVKESLVVYRVNVCFLRTSRSCV